MTIRILITSLPGYGHLCPLIPVAKTLQQAGHEVAFATSRRAVGKPLPDSFTLFACGPDWHESDFAHDMVGQGSGSMPLPFYRFLGEIVVPYMLRSLEQIIARWHPDVIVSNEFERAGCTLAEKHRIPFVLVSGGPRMSLAQRRRFHAPLFEEPRKLVGLAPDPELHFLCSAMHVYLTPQQYSFEPDYQAASNEFGIRVEPADLSIDGASDFDVSMLGRHPKSVLCTFGTVFNKNVQLIKAIVDEFRDSHYQLVLVRGPGVDYEFAADSPNLILIPEFVPLFQIIPHTSFSISHGGTATLLSLLQSGRPMLILPQGADQGINATACARLGLASRVPDSVIYRSGDVDGEVHLRAGELHQAMQMMDVHGDMRIKSKEMAANFARLPALVSVVGLIENWLTRKNGPLEQETRG